MTLSNEDVDAIKRRLVKLTVMSRPTAPMLDSARTDIANLLDEIEILEQRNHTLIEIMREM